MRPSHTYTHPRRVRRVPRRPFLPQQHHHTYATWPHRMSSNSGRRDRLCHAGQRARLARRRRGRKVVLQRLHQSVEGREAPGYSPNPQPRHGAHALSRVRPVRRQQHSVTRHRLREGLRPSHQLQQALRLRSPRAGQPGWRTKDAVGRGQGRRRGLVPQQNGWGRMSRPSPKGRSYEVHVRQMRQVRGSAARQVPSPVQRQANSPSGCAPAGAVRLRSDAGPYCWDVRHRRVTRTRCASAGVPPRVPRVYRRVLPHRHHVRPHHLCQNPDRDLRFGA